MIPREAIRERSAEWQLRVNVVEKDYVLGWKIKAFDTAKIENLRATTTPFTPRYRIEFTAPGLLTAQPMPRRPGR